MIDLINPSTKKNWIPALAGLRAIAILLVVVRHIYDQALPFLSDNFLFRQTLGFGWMGVFLFFAISGFLVGGGVIDKIERGTYSPWNFLIQRFFRILPPAIFVYFVASLSISDWDSRAILNLTLTCNLVAPYDCFGLFWSLCVEEHFYIALCLVATAICALGLRGSFSVRALVWSIVLYIVTRFLFFWLFLNFLMRVEHSLVYGDAFLFGILAWRLAPKVKLIAAKWGTAWWGVLFGGIAILSLLFTEQNMPAQNFSQPQITLGLFYPALFAWSAFCVLGVVSFQNIFTRILSSRPLEFVAKISFSLYLWHLPIIKSQWLYFDNIGYFGWIICVLSASLIVASLSYYLIERPSLRLGKYLAARFAPGHI